MARLTPEQKEEARLKALFALECLPVDDTLAMEGVFDFFKKEENTDSKNLNSAIKRVKELLASAGEVPSTKTIKIGPRARWLSLRGNVLDNGDQVIAELTRMCSFAEAFDLQYERCTQQMVEQFLTQVLIPQTKDFQPERIAKFRQDAKHFFPDGLNQFMTVMRLDSFKRRCKGTADFLGSWYAINQISGNPEWNKCDLGLGIYAEPSGRSVKGGIVKPYTKAQVEKILAISEKYDTVLDRFSASLKKTAPALMDKVYIARREYMRSQPKWEQCKPSDPIRETVMLAYTLEHNVGDKDGQLVAILQCVDHALGAAMMVSELSLNRMS